ncbi:ABC transporter ATP-binding protein [Hazenella sp. IB182357]|uniref:ABC transporter ATP-binding protein n=1 Tax=Polycladospora coralii TaxID=2771432 RepID=A0A926N9R5_9BACL|nr:ABC transporter ATP-binding protein [Polycladospora coralii]MBD1372368.1 ABC transporter ATP-binding protein [Polycladospora coralii]MBS7531442.1 ABC transporter ATP-binding protein [Polycladospora coralii]
MIKIESMVKNIGSFELGPINLQFEAGYIYGLVGPNRSGKTTLIQTLTQHLKPNQGRITWFGKQAAHNEQFIKQNVCYMPAEFDGPANWKVGDFCQFARMWYPNWNDAIVLKLLTQFELKKEEKYAKLSTGAKKKLQFVLAMASNCPFMILDEPTNGIDFKSRKFMLDYLVEWMEQGERTLLITSHHIDEIQRLADIIILIHNGKQIGQYEKDQLISNWKQIWLPTPVQTEIPGVVAMQNEAPYSVITKQANETLAYLEKSQVDVIKVRSLDMEDVLAQLVG